MLLTRKEAVRLHRLLWSSIAYLQECSPYKEVTKEDALFYLLEHHKITKELFEVACMNSGCFACAYTSQFIEEECRHCVIDWGNKSCTYPGTSYEEWYFERDLITRAYSARKISMLPQREHPLEKFT